MDDLYSLLRRLKSEDAVLDLGCGHGSFQYEACRGRIIGLDLTLPDKSLQRPQAAYVRADSIAIPLANASVDAVISHHTLEHFPEYRKTLAEIRRILSPAGWLWIAVPNGYGLDDALYRFLYAGGGHVNRFRYDSLIAEVESLTNTRFVRSCDLFSGFVYLHRPDVPENLTVFCAMALNTVTRLSDKIAGTRLSRYGWAFVFARQAMPMDTMPSYFNVCRKCGSGNSAEFLKSGIRKTAFGVRFYNCPNCGERNVFVSPPPDFD